MENHKLKGAKSPEQEFTHVKFLEQKRATGGEWLSKYRLPSALLSSGAQLAADNSWVTRMRAKLL